MKKTPWKFKKLTRDDLPAIVLVGAGGLSWHDRERPQCIALLLHDRGKDRSQIWDATVVTLKGDGRLDKFNTACYENAVRCITRR